MNDLTQERLKEVLDYDPDTGVFHWRISLTNSVKCGATAGNIRNSLYIQYILIRIDGNRYLAHRLAFLYVTGKWPTKDIDHIDRDGLNNKWENLREATRSQNIANSKIRLDNTTGFKGVRLQKQTGQYEAYITVQNKYVHLGTFEKPESAHSAYLQAAQKHFGEFARSS